MYFYLPLAAKRNLSTRRAPTPSLWDSILFLQKQNPLLPAAARLAAGRARGGIAARAQIDAKHPYIWGRPHGLALRLALRGLDAL